MRFNDIPGLEAKKSQLLTAANNNQVAHAQLFAGKTGSPALAMAVAYATYLNCENKQENDSCGVCSACSKNGKLVHPDLHFVFPVSGTKDVKAEEAVSDRFLPTWRNFLLQNPYGDLEAWAEAYGGENKQVNISKRESREIIKSLSLMAFEGQYKIMIVWLPEYMHPTAANGILKILEEPPQNTVFILVTHDYERLLATITSRTQMVTIPSFDDAAVVALLHEKHGIPTEKAGIIAALADGDLNAALKIAHHEDDDNHSFFTNWMRSCFKREFSALVNMADSYHKTSKLSQRSLIKYALTIIRESLICKNAPEINRINGAVLEFTKKFSGALNEKKLIKITELLDEAYFHLERNGSPKMIFLDLSLQIAANIK